MANTFSISKFFEKKRQHTRMESDDAIEMIDLQKRRYTSPDEAQFLKRENNILSKSLGSIDDNFHAQLKAWYKNPFTFSVFTEQEKSQKEQENAKRALIQLLNSNATEEEKIKALSRHSLEQRKNLKKNQLDYLLYTAWLLEKLYLENGRIDKAKNIRSEADRLKESAFNPDARKLSTETPSDKPLLEFLLVVESYLGKINLWRLDLCLARVTTEALLKDGWLDFLNKELDIEQLTKDIDKTKSTGNALSVILFAARLVLILINITIQCMDETSVDQDIRFWNLFWEKLGNIVNDAFWTLFNLLTNYSDTMGIPGPAANVLLCFALLGDIIWTLRGWYKDANTFEAKKAEYLEELKNLDENSKEYKMTMESLKQLIIKSEVNNATNLYATIAAVLLALTSALPILITALAPYLPDPAIIMQAMPKIGIGCDGVSNIAVGIYQTIGRFSTCMEKRRELAWLDADLVLENGELVKRDWKATDAMDDLIHTQQKKLLTLEYEFARNRLWFDLLICVVMPVALMSLSAVCFPLGAAAPAIFFVLVKFVLEPWWDKKQQKDLDDKKQEFIKEQDALGTAGLLGHRWWTHDKPVDDLPDESEENDDNEQTLLPTS